MLTLNGNATWSRGRRSIHKTGTTHSVSQRLLNRSNPCVTQLLEGLASLERCRVNTIST